MIEYIYYLICPKTKEVKYVGKTKNPKKRYFQHIKKLDRSMTKKRIWLEMLFSENLAPILKIVEKCENGNGREREQHHVTLNKETTLNIHNPEKGAKSIIGMHPKSKNYGIQ